MDSGTMKILGIIVVMGLLTAVITKVLTQRSMDGINDYAERAQRGEIDPQEQLERIEEVWSPKEPEPANPLVYAAVGLGTIVLVGGPLGFKIYQASQAEQAIAAEAAKQPKPKRVPADAQESPE